MQAALADNAGLDADAKKRKRDSTPEHLRAQSLDPEEKLPRSNEPRSRNREDASEAWTLRLPRTLVSHLRDLCERGSAEHFITVRAKAQDTSITLLGWWTVETSRETPQSSHVSPRWMQEPMLLRSEQDGELWVTMHTHPRAAITQSLNTVPSLRRRQQLARTNPLLYVPSLADVNNMLRYGMHASIVRRRPSQCPSSAHAPLWGGAWPALAGSGRLVTARRRNRSPGCPARALAHAPLWGGAWPALAGSGRLVTARGRDRSPGCPARASAARASRLQGGRLRRPRSPRHVHIVVTPFHWFVCHVPRPSAPERELDWDMQTLLAESESHERTAADWASVMNARCDNFSVVLLPAESIDFGAASGVPFARGVPWVHCTWPPLELWTHRPADRLSPCVRLAHCQMTTTVCFSS